MYCTSALISGHFLFTAKLVFVKRRLYICMSLVFQWHNSHSSLLTQAPFCMFYRISLKSIGIKVKYLVPFPRIALRRNCYMCIL